MAIFAYKGVLMLKKDYKIAVVSETLHLGGVGLITIHYAYCLSGLGYDTTLVVLDPTNPDGINLQQRDNLSYLLLEGPYTLKDFVGLLSLFDIVILSNTAIMPFAMEASRYLSNTFVIEILHTATKAAIAPTVDLTVAVSRHIYESMSPRPLDIILPNGVDTELFRPVPRLDKPHKVRLIQIAREGKVMEPDLADIAEELVTRGFDIEAWIVGRDGQDSKHIKYFGITPYFELPRLLQNCDILLHMSLEESFGMTALEAMACGVIPVVSNVGGLLEVVVDKKTGFVLPKGDRLAVLNTLTRLIEGICEEDSTVKEIQNEAVKRARGHFDIKLIMAELIDRAKVLMTSMKKTSCYSHYPFSFVAPFLFLVHRSYDRYLYAFEDIKHSDELDKALRDWKEFYGLMVVNIKDKASLSLLDAIYSGLVSDLKNRDYQKAQVINYYLSVNALLVGQLDRLKTYITFNGAKVFTLTVFSVIAMHRSLIGITDETGIIELAYHIKHLFMLCAYEDIKAIPITQSNLNTIISKWGYGGLLD